MKNVSLFLLFSLIIAPFMRGQEPGSDKIDPILIERLQQAPDDYQDIRILLSDRLDILSLDVDFYKENASLETRTRTLIHKLKEKASQTQGPVLQSLQSRSDVSGSSIEPLWIANVILARMHPDAIHELSQRADIEIIVWDAPVEPVKFEEVSSAPLSPNGHEPGHDAINAPAMWALGYTGYGRVAMIIDSGIDGEHPALKSRYRGNYVPASEAWFDETGNTDPNNCGDHGSHVTGTILGLNASTRDTIGVAFNSLWTGSPGLCSGTSTLGSFQWAIDPDGDSTTISDMPDVINNSWRSLGGGAAECSGDFKDAFDALEAAGVAVVFAAGNSGPDSLTITDPSNINTSLVNVFAVASVNGNISSTPISSFSSRGPSQCGGTGSLLIKPEVSAPGQNVRSSILNGGYAFFSGTSMAAPHASGAILLLKEAFPYLTGAEIKLALYYSAIDLGAPGEDNTYGMGLIDVIAAYNYLIAEGNTPDSTIASANFYDIGINEITSVANIECEGGANPEVVLFNAGDSVLTSVKIIYSYSGLIVDSLNWTGTLTSGMQETVSLPGVTLPQGAYRLEINAVKPNGFTDLRFLDNFASTSFFVVENVSPVTTSAAICEGSSALLTASSTVDADIQWYDTPNGGTPIASGSPFLTPVLLAPTTYYASVTQTGSAGLPDSALRDRTSDITKSMVFDCFSPFKLVSVKVHSQLHSPRAIQLLDGNGDTLYYQSIMVDTGLQEIMLNIDIPVGTNYQLGTDGFSKFSFSDSLLNYPYVFPGVLSIKSSSDGQGIYYYFYDWKVEFETVCGRTPAEVSIEPGSVSPSFSASTNAIDLSVSGTVQFIDNTTGATAWSWDFGDGTSSTLQNPSHTYTDSGLYVVTLTVTGSGGCSGSITTDITATGIVGLDSDLEALGTITLFPNPSTSIFTLELSLDQAAYADLSVFDTMGKSIFQQRTDYLQYGKTAIDLSQYPDGIYYLKITIEGKTGLLKMIKLN